MTRLIYHPFGTTTQNVSPLDEAIMGVVDSSSIKIACPYLGRIPIQRIINHSYEWQLITDVEELLRSQVGSDRDWFVGFLVSNITYIRHCPRLHAKTILTNQHALVGSANFTISGLTRRTEMMVSLSDPNVVEELRAWYYDLWESCSQCDEKVVVDFANSLPAHSSTQAESRLFSHAIGPQVNAKLQPLKRTNNGDSEIKDAKYWTTAEVESEFQLEGDTTALALLDFAKEHSSEGEYVTSHPRKFARFSFVVEGRSITKELERRTVLNCTQNVSGVEYHLNIGEVDRVASPAVRTEFRNRLVSIFGNEIELQRTWTKLNPVLVSVHIAEFESLLLWLKQEVISTLSSQ